MALSLFTLLHGSVNAAGLLRSVTLLQDHLEAELLVVHPDPIAGNSKPMSAPEGIVTDVQMDDLDVASQQARRAFGHVCSGKPSCRFKQTNSSADDALRKQALFADLCVLARVYGVVGDDLSVLKSALVANRLPTVLLPRDPLPAAPATVVCAWNGQAASARAIRAAIPFARKAGRVVVLEHAGNEVNRNRLEHFLHSQGVAHAEWRPYGDASLTARGRARALLAETKSCGGDLLVMGAYGEATERFFQFGRATEKVATSAKIPVLLCH